LLVLRQAGQTGGMMYDAYQRLADAGDQVRMLAENANAILSA